MKQLLVATVILLSACTDTESYVEMAEGVPLLLGEFRSYSSEQVLRASLTSWSVRELERSGLDPHDTRPPFTIVRLAVADFIHIGFKGELRFELFNDRLMSIWFYPDDLDGYLAALKPTKRQEAAAVHVFSHRDYRNRAYVGWEDRRLVDQSSRWISRYA